MDMQEYKGYFIDGTAKRLGRRGSIIEVARLEPPSFTRGTQAQDRIVGEYSSILGQFVSRYHRITLCAPVTLSHEVPPVFWTGC
jgi:hypothetical protein